MSAVAVDERQRQAELAAAISESSQKLRELEEQRPFKRAGDPDQVWLESRIAGVRRHLDGLHTEFAAVRERVEAAAEAERQRLEEEKLARRPSLEKARDGWQRRLDVALSCIEYALHDLAGAVEGALTADANVQAAKVELEELDRVRGRLGNVIGERIGARLRGVGIGDFYAVGRQGQEPLADPATARALVVERALKEAEEGRTGGAQAREAAQKATSGGGTRSDRSVAKRRTKRS